MNRRRLVVAALCVCLASAAAACSSDENTAPESTTTLGSLGASMSSTAAPTPVLPEATRVGLGLTKLLAANPLTAQQTERQLTTCPFGPVRTFARTVDAATGSETAKLNLAYAQIQRYQVRKPNEGVIGDRGVAAACTGRVGNTVVLGLSAATNSEPTPTGELKGLDGPVAYRQGETYANAGSNRRCSVYWVPPKRNYVLAVTFRTPDEPSVEQCRRGFGAAAPTMIAALAKLAG